MLLLDTCTLIWIAEDHTKLSPPALARLTAGGTDAPRVSAISAFEVAVKWQKRRLALPSDPLTWFGQVVHMYALSVEPISWEDGVQAALLPRHHNDRMDRMIIACAMRLGASVVTPDPLIAQYTQVQTIW